jgi:hypothetical protein
MSKEPRVAVKGVKKKLMSAGRKALLLGLGLAMTPWAPGNGHVIVFGLYVTLVLYPELSPRRRSWVRELLMAWVAAHSTKR